MVGLSGCLTMWAHGTVIAEVNGNSVVRVELVIEGIHWSVTGAGRKPWIVKFEQFRIGGLSSV